jgi:hypothetical protein
MVTPMFSRKLIRSIAVVTMALAVGGGAYGIVSATAGSNSAVAETATTMAVRSNARSGPAAGGTVGTVGRISKSSFTVSTSAGQKVTVHWASASTVTNGQPVLVLGTTSGTTITATQVIVQPPAGGGSAPSSPVVPFQRGAPTTSKQIGQVPPTYRQGSGTIVGGTTANKATEAALAAYPGGIVDRVVKLSNGEYEVHNIGVNWPHHVFVNKNFKVIGAN